MRPLTEYNTSSWSPHYKSDIHEIETVQKKFTRKVCQRANLTFSNYEERLDKLNLESLEIRRIKRDLTLLYKIVNQLIDTDINDFFEFSSFGGIIYAVIIYTSRDNQKHTHYADKISLHTES